MQLYKNFIGMKLPKGALQREGDESSVVSGDNEKCYKSLCCYRDIKNLTIAMATLPSYSSLPDVGSGSCVVRLMT